MFIFFNRNYYGSLENFQNLILSAARRIKFFIEFSFQYQNDIALAMPVDHWLKKVTNHITRCSP